MEYTHSDEWGANTREALETMRNALVQNGFRLEHTSDSGFEAQGPGMNSNRENLLRGASRVRLTLRGQTAVFEAELGAVRRLQYFCVLFPQILVAGLAVLFYFVLPGAGPKMPLVLAPISLVWLIVGPGMAWFIGRSVQKALDNLAISARTISQSGRDI